MGNMQRVSKQSLDTFIKISIEVNIYDEKCNTARGPSSPFFIDIRVNSPKCSSHPERIRSYSLLQHWFEVFMLH